MIKAQNNRILFISVTGITNKIYLDQSVMYRCYNYCSSLEEKGYVSVVCSYKDFDLKMIDCFDVFIFHRPQYDEKLNEAIEKIKNQKKQLYADYDDLVIGENNYEYYPRYQLGLSSKEDTTEYFRINTKAFSKFQNILVSTDELKNEVLRLDENKNVYILYNAISKELLNISKKILQNHKGNTYFNIGFFAGSLMHKLSFVDIEKALLNLIDNHSNIRLFLVGGIFDEFEISKHKHTILIDRVSYEEYLEMLSKMHLNLSPLILDNFSKCKSTLKVFEAGVLKVPTIVKRTIDSNRLQDSGTVYIDDDLEWKQKILTAYKNRNNKEYIEKIYDFCFTNCRVDFEVDKLINIIEGDK